MVTIEAGGGRKVVMCNKVYSALQMNPHLQTFWFKNVKSEGNQVYVTVNGIKLRSRKFLKRYYFCKKKSRGVVRFIDRDEFNWAADNLDMRPLRTLMLLEMVNRQGYYYGVHKVGPKEFAAYFTRKGVFYGSKSVRYASRAAAYNAYPSLCKKNGIEPIIQKPAQKQRVRHNRFSL